MSFARFAPAESRTILRLALPIMATQLAMVGMGTLDTVMSGYVSTLDLAGVAIGAAIWTPIWLFLAGLMVALSSSVSRAHSGSRHEEVPKLLQSGIALGLIWGLLLGLALILIGWGLPYWIEDRTSADVAKYYLMVFAPAMPASGLFLALRFHAEALNEPGQVTRIMLTGLALNVPLNFLFIHGISIGDTSLLPGLGGVGCGVASSIVFTFMALTLLHNTRKRRLPQGFPLWQDVWSFSDPMRKRSLMEMNRIGVPIGIALFFEVSLFTATALFLTDLGPVVVAGHQVAINVSSITFMFPLSISLALTVRVGHYLGLNDYAGARLCALTGIGMNLVIALMNASAIWLGADAIAGLYSPDPAVVAMGASLLIYAALFQIPDTIQVATAGALRAYEDTFVIMVITFIAYWVIGFCSGWYLAYLCDEPLGAAGFWIGLIIGLTAAAIALMTRLHRVSRRTSP